MFNRSRTDGGFITVPGSCVETYYYTVTAPTTASTSHGPFGSKRTTLDVVTPEFRRKVNQGVVVNNPFSSIKETLTNDNNGSRVSIYTKTPPPSPGTNYIQKIERIPGFNGNWCGVVGDTECVVDRNALIISASTKARANIARPEVEGLPFLGELRQTIELLRNPIKGMEDHVKKVLTTRKKIRKLDTAKVIADQHLAIAFGLKPLMHDIEGALKNLYRKTKSNRRTARGFATMTANSTATRTYNDGAVSASIFDVKTRKVDVRAGSLYETAFDLGLSKWGLTISDIPAAVWELTPWSFVADWVSNLGDYISAITPKIGTNLLTEWYTVHETTTCVSTIGTSIITLNPDYTTTGGGAKRTRVVQANTRTPSNLGDYVAVQFEPSLNLNRTVLSLSLLTQQLSRVSEMDRTLKPKPYGLKKYQKVWQFYAH